MQTFRLIFKISLLQLAFLEMAHSQSKLEIREVNFTELKRFWLMNKSIDKEQLFYFQVSGKRVGCSRKTGLVYVFDMNSETLRSGKSELINDGYSESKDYCVDESMITWRKKEDKKLDSGFILKTYNFETNESKSISFRIPQKLLRIFKPVILDGNRVLINNLIFYGRDSGKIDTLKAIGKVKIPDPGDNTLMRKNLYLSDPCFNAKERCSQDFLGLSFTRLTDREMTTFVIAPKNISIPINTYRIEAEYQGVLFLSNKMEPNKFLLYEMKTQDAFPFILDSSIFNAERLVEKRPSHNSNSINEYPPPEIDFTFACTMDQFNLYITLVLRPTNEVKVFRVENYKSIMH